jgi:hypothetical protein
MITEAEATAFIMTPLSRHLYGGMRKRMLSEFRIGDSIEWTERRKYGWNKTRTNTYLWQGTIQKLSPKTALVWFVSMNRADEPNYRHRRFGLLKRVKLSEINARKELV